MVAEVFPEGAPRPAISAYIFYNYMAENPIGVL